MIMKLCKYVIEDVDIIFRDGSKELIPKENIIFLYIEKSFVDNFFPITCLQVNVTKKMYNKIIKNKDTVLFNLKVKKFLNNNTVENITKTNTKSVIDGLFNMITDNTEASNLDIEKENKSLNNSPEKDSMKLSLFLFKQNHLLKYKTRYNYILQNTTLSTAITFIASKNNMKLLMSPLDNNVRRQIIILPYTFIGLIEYLQKVYGLYNNGYILFNDYDVVYLLNDIGKCTALRNGELNRIYIYSTDVDNTKRANMGCYYNSSNNEYRININEKPIISNNNQLPRIIGDKLTFVDTKTRNKTDINLNNNSSNNYVLDNRYGNNIAINEYSKNLKNNILLQLKMIDIEFDVLTPNKEYYINLDDNNDIKKYSNIYKLKRTVINLYKGKGEFFNSICECEFENV